MSAADVEPQWGSVLVDPAAPSLPALKVKFLLEHLPAMGSVLEVGSGGGKLLRTIARHRPGLALHGCDVRDPQSPPDCYSFRRIENGLPHEAAAFDAVVLFDVLEHVAEPGALLDDVARVLRPGGRLVAFIPVEGEALSFYELFRRLLGENLYVETKDHVQAFTHRGLAQLLGARFTTRVVQYAYHPLGQLMDAAFFAAHRLPRLKTFWWRDNAIYHGKKREASAATSTLNFLLEAGNALAFAESTLLARTRAGSAGVLLEALVAPVRTAR
jgi:SAM-dependent methyltransferase